MFKKLVAMIVNIENHEDFDKVCGMIEITFNHDKISRKDYELLYALLNKITIND